MAKPPKKNKLSAADKLFVMHMTRPGTPTFNNATQSYIAAFKPKIDELNNEGRWVTQRAKPRTQNEEEEEVKPARKYIQSERQKAYEVCKTMGGRLFSRVHIKDACDERLRKLFGDNDQLDLRHAQLLFQDEDKHVSLAALRDANKLKKRVNDDPVLPPNAQPITNIEIVIGKDMVKATTTP